MPRSIPADRFPQLVAVATKTFVACGYRLTQMSDLADELGVAKGTLYGYVESKEALFDAAVRFADGHGTTPEPSALPLATPPAGSTVRYVRERLVAEARELELVSAVGRAKPKGSGAEELQSIVRDLYKRMAKHRRALKLVDRCAVDYPDLAGVWFNEGRWAQVSLLAGYLEKRIAQGHLRAVPNIAVAARLLLETIAVAAIHMPWDPSPRPLAEEHIEAYVVDMLVYAHLKERGR